MSIHKEIELSVIVPAFNEELGVAPVLSELAENFPEAEIIVVDDGSKDNTLSVIKEVSGKYRNVIAYHHIFNRGYGASLKTGMEKATGKYVAWFDSDGEHKCKDLKNMVDIIRQDNVAAVIGQRSSDSSNFVRGVGKSLIRLLARSVRIKAGEDLNCGLRIFRREVILPYLSILPTGYSASLTTTILMSERGYAVRNFPVTTAERIGNSKVKLRDGFSALLKVLRLVTLFSPLRIFFMPGFFIFMIGMVYGVIVTITERAGFPTAGVVLSLMGLLLCIFGLIADQISQIRLELRNPGGLVKAIKLDETDLHKSRETSME